MNKPSTIEAATAFGLSIVIVAAIVSVVLARSALISGDTPCCHDHHYYLAMAGNSSVSVDEVPAPYAYRVVSPWIAGALPGSAEVGFFALTVAALVATLFLFYLLLRALDFDDLTAVSGLVIAGSLYWFIEFSVTDFALVDPLSFFLAMLILYLLLINAPLSVLTVVLVIATLNKESALVFVPVSVLALWRNGARDLMGFMILCTLPVLTFVVVRLVVDAEPVSGSVVDWRLSARYWPMSKALDDVRQYLFATWGPLLLIIALRPVALWSFICRRPGLLLLFVVVHLQLFVATDTSRLLMLAFPSVISAVLVALQGLGGSSRIVLGLAVGLAIMQGLYFEYYRQAVPFVAGASGSFDAQTRDLQLPILLVTGLATILIALIRNLSQRRRRLPDPIP